MLIKNEIELKAVLGGVQQNITWETFEPFVKQAELNWIAAAIGEELYNELEVLELPNGLQAKLIDRLKIACGYYALSTALPQLVTVVGDGGAVVSNNGGTGMYKWMYDELKNGSFATADKAVEDALVWLEKNKDAQIEGAKVFQTWLDSDAYTVSNELLISNATELSMYFPNANGSRRFYLKVREYMKRVEMFELVELLGLEFVAELRKDSNDTFMKMAQELVKNYVAHRAVSESLPFLNINENFELVSVDQYSLLKGKYALDGARRDSLKLGVDGNAERFKSKMMAFLDKNAMEAVFVKYYTSGNYKVSSTSKGYTRKKNDASKNYVVI